MRKNWSFNVPVREVRTALEGRINYVDGRIAWWKAELDKANTELRATGIEIKEQQFTGGGRLEAVIDQSIGKRIQECTHKLRKHQENLDEYESFFVGLKYRQDGELLPLGSDDIAWFGLAGNPRNENEDES